jgi:hypothetical protein
VCERRRVASAPRALALLLALLSPSCDQESLPAAPSDVTSGVTLYEHANYEGESALVTRSIGNLGDFNGPCALESGGGPPTYVSTTVFDWNDCISSVRIAPGWRAVVYRDDDYDGDSLEVTGDLPNLLLVRGDCDHDGMNDCISSISVTPPQFAGNVSQLPPQTRSGAPGL